MLSLLLFLLQFCRWSFAALNPHHPHTSVRCFRCAIMCKCALLAATTSYSLSLCVSPSSRSCLCERERVSVCDYMQPPPPSLTTVYDRKANMCVHANMLAPMPVYILDGHMRASATLYQTSHTQFFTQTSQFRMKTRSVRLCASL